jgi:hypothetical protein
MLENSEELRSKNIAEKQRRSAGIFKIPKKHKKLKIHLSWNPGILR